MSPPLVLLERGGIQQAQVLLTRLRNALDLPAADAGGGDSADDGDLAGSAERLDDVDGVGVVLLLSLFHAAILGAPNVVVKRT
jgi:hypothetical protein